MTAEVEERFWNKVHQRGTDECWPWLACTDRDGYGKFGLAGTTVRSPRLARELWNAKELGDLTVDHTCVNPSCCNPAHLDAVTIRINVQRNSRSRATHCKHGHLFDEKNTRRRPNGTRTCRACSNLSSKRSKGR